MTTIVQMSAGIGLKWIGEDTQEVTTYSDPNTVRDERRWVSEPNGTLAAGKFTVPAGGTYDFFPGNIQMSSLGYTADQLSSAINGFAFRSLGGGDITIATDTTDGWSAAISAGVSLPDGGVMVFDTEDIPYVVSGISPVNEMVFSNAGGLPVDVEFIVWGEL